VNSHKQTASAKNSSAELQLDVEREIRFAVVMYGGVSLAIYINGVAQELLSMVRATARANPDPTKDPDPQTSKNEPSADQMLLAPEELSASEKVYREIAKLLDQKSGFTNEPTELTQTRFIVDVISGTSAGGINGVFLAKALVRNQTMNGLKSLWLSEGDLGKLLNDTKAEDYAPELGFGVQKPEKSLLNSQRMYRKLLQALAEMNQKSPADEIKAEQEPSPLVKELDLFVTTTDIEGIPLPIQLADGVVYERRYRNVFHFRYADETATLNQRDDFFKKNDPFLAFAARCTSSFPFAFDAMQLNDIEKILGRYQRYQDDDPKSGKHWDVFIKDYLRLGLIDINRKARGGDALGVADIEAAGARLREAFRNRSFGDGGYLDNKPFSYATSLLMRRSSDCVVDRKLLYVEPTPEHPELAPREPGPRPDFAENVRAAVLDLPRQETIREDIERIYERNAILERVGSFAKYVDEDASLVDPPKRFTHAEFVGKDLHEMMDRYGASYGAYHRLKVHEITELLTCLIARALGHDPASDAADAIRQLVTIWRNHKYKLLHPPGEREDGKNNQKTENEFLLDYDIHYRLRRLSFLSRRINQLAGIGQSGQVGSIAKSLLLAWLSRELKPITAKEDQPKENSAPPPPPNLPQLTELQAFLNSNGSNGRFAPTETSPDPDQWLKDFRQELRAVKKAIAKPTQDARFTEEQFLDPDSQGSQSLKDEIAKVKLELPWKDLASLLSKDPEEKQAAIAGFRRDGLIMKLDKVADKVCELLKNRSPSGFAIASAENSNPTKGNQAARMCLKHYYDNFLLYDLITYPIQYGTSAGEANIVRVYRVSPEDASALMQEKAGGPRDKLAGRTLMSFGAFLDENWRRNDMLWGRLDGAERLITILLANQVEAEECAKFIRRAHTDILWEEILQGNGDAVCRLLSNVRAHSDGTPHNNIEIIVQELLKKPELAPHITDARRNYLVGPQKFERRLDPETALKYISRSTNITGNMLEGLAEQHRFNGGKRMAGWVTRFGATFWNMIAVAVPQSLGNIFFRHWLGLLYLFSAVVILAGIAFKSVGSLGWQLLGATVSLHVLTLLVGDFIGGKHRWLRAARRFGILLVAGLIGFGAYFVLDRSLKFFSDQDRASIIGVITGFVVLVLLGFMEWRHWLKNFLRSPTTSFSYRLLGGLTIATAVLVGTLIVIGPADMIGFELSRAASIADPFKAHVGVDRLRIQLGLDFALIVAYATMLASYCVAGAKLFWERRENLAYRFQQDRQAARAQARTQSNPASTDAKDPIAKGSLRLKLFYALLVVGFAFAGLQWLAAIADASENIGLLLYLKDTPPPNFNGLELAYWSATIKFWLIAAGAIYAAIAFSFGAWKKLGERPTTLKPTEVGLRIVFVAVSLIYFGFSAYALFVCRPSPQQCSPQLLPEIWTRLFH